MKAEARKICHKLQNHQTGIFQSLGTINFIPVLLKDKVKRTRPGGGGGGGNGTTLNTLLTALHLFCDTIIIKTESTIFSDIDKLVALF